MLTLDLVLYAAHDRKRPQLYRRYELYTKGMLMWHIIGFALSDAVAIVEDMTKRKILVFYRIFARDKLATALFKAFDMHD